MTKTSTLPVLSSTETPADAFGFFEAVALAGLENVAMTVSYAVQRKHFGKIIFGKKRVLVNEIGQIQVTYSTGYNKEDYDLSFYVLNGGANKLDEVSDIPWAKFSKSVA